MKQYEPLLKEVAQEEDSLVQSTVDNEAARAKFIMTLSNTKPRPTFLRPAVLLPVAMLCLLAVAGGVYFSTLHGSAISTDPQWVQVGPNDQQVLSFKDGTNVRFEENSTGRVIQNDEHQGEVTLESGRVALKVTHTDSTDWTVLAGPYQVKVTGTQFEVRWSAEQKGLTVNVFEGSVLVTGPMLETGHAVTANRSLSADLSSSNVQLTQLSKGNTTDSSSATDTGAEQLEGNSASEQAEDAPNKTARSHKFANAERNRFAWVQDAEAGDYTKVSNQIASVGLTKMLRGAKPAAYLVLGNAARQARDFSTAQTVYQMLRKQYPGSGHAATAALYMGRMAFDQQRQYPTAVKWFNIYLTEQKSGTLHRETLGRLMEAQYKSNMRSEAQQTASRYLSQYPNGPHSGRAKELSGQ